MNIKRTKNHAGRQSPKGDTGSNGNPDQSHESVVWSGRARLIASVLIILHLLAVVAEPLRFFSRSPENFAAADTALLRRTLGPYVDAMYLSHGYFFFAPNPGPAHLIECQVTPNSKVASSINSDLDKSRWKIYPDRKDQWPRLLYHRHFMLSEFYNTLFAPTELENAADIDQRIVDQWRDDRRIYESLQDCLKKNLISKHPDHEVVLKRIQHELPNPRTVFVDRWKLTDPRLYNELLEGPVKEATGGALPNQLDLRTKPPAALARPADLEKDLEQIVPQKQLQGDAKVLDPNNQQMNRPSVVPGMVPRMRPSIDPSENRGNR